MAGVLEQIRRPRKKLVRYNVSSAKIDPKALELQAATEILAEVFNTNISDVDEMLKLRCEEGLEGHASYLRKRKKQGQWLLKHGYNKAGEWPMEFCLAEE